MIDGRETDGRSDAGDEAFDEASGTPTELDEDLLLEDEELVEERLELEEDERLPWLESADYEDESRSSDTGKLVGVILIGILALALLLGALYWLTNSRTDEELVADGSTIEAPEGPFRERPEDPGGRTFEGTGNVAPAVGEGETREGRLASDDARSGDRGSGSRAGGGDARSGSNAQASSRSGDRSGGASAGSGGVGVQVGAYATRDGAERGWNIISRQTDALSGVKYRIVQGQADIGTVYRLQAVPGDMAAANRLCSALKADGVACQVKR